jgi:hypothetical protein
MVSNAGRFKVRTNGESLTFIKAPLMWLNPRTRLRPSLRHDFMSSRLAVVLNGTLQLEYHRDKPLPEAQRQYLDRMDHFMDSGIALGGVQIDAPDQLQRAQFVASSLIQSLRNDNESLAAASCAYLATRIPELRQVKATDVNAQQSIDLVFDKDYVPEQTIKFVKPESLKNKP